MRITSATSRTPTATWPTGSSFRTAPARAGAASATASWSGTESRVRRESRSRTSTVTSARRALNSTGSSSTPRLRVLRVGGRVSAAAILALFAFGTVMLATMLRWGYVAVGAVLLAVVPWLLDGLARRSRFVHAAAIAPVAVVAPVVTSLGVDVLWSSAVFRVPRQRPGWRSPASSWPGWAYAYLSWVGKPPPRHHRLWALRRPRRGRVGATDRSGPGARDAHRQPDRGASARGARVPAGARAALRRVSAAWRA